MKTCKKAIQEEYQQANKEKRYPRCVYCGAPLVILWIPVWTTRWVWDPMKATYTWVQRNEDHDRPYCAYCGAEDGGFLRALPPRED